MKILTGFLLIVFSLPSSAQILKQVKNKIVDKAKQETNEATYNAKQKAKASLHKELDDFKAGFDSTDIDYAILVSDNSGIFGGRGKGEFGAKFIRLTGIANSFYKDADLDDEENARLNLQLGQSGYATGRYVYAEKRLKTAERYFDKANLTDDIAYIKTISSQGLLYTSMGRFLQAEQLTAQALQLREKKLGSVNMSVAASLNNYAVLHYNLAYFNESEKEFTKALAIIKSNNQEMEMPYAIVLNNQAILYQSLGRMQEAIKNLEEAISISSKQEETKTKNHLKFLANLALLYQQMEKYAAAEKIYNELGTKLEKGKPEMATMLNNEAILFMLMKKDDKVEEKLKQSASIFKTTLGDKSPAYAKIRSDLGNFYRYNLKWAESEPLLREALQIREFSLGQQHPLYVQSLEDLAILYWKKKEWAKAYALYHESMEKSLSFINKYFPPMSEAEKAKYWELLSMRFQRFFNFAVDAAPVINEVLFDLYEYRIATKGLLFSSSRKINAVMQGSGNEQLIHEYNIWIDQKEQLTSLYAYSKEELKEQNINLDSIETAANSMEKKLSELSTDFAKFFFTSKTKFVDVQQSLKDNEAAIEIIRVRNFEQVFGDDSRYIIVIVAKNNAQPILIVINNGSDLDGKIAKAYRMSMKNKVNDEQSFIHYWEPLESGLKGIKKIFVSPDGVYNQLNLYTFKKPAGDYLINQYDITLLGNTRDIVINRKKEKNTVLKKATLIGFPVFGSSKIPELPATKNEVENINKVLVSSGYQVSAYIQRDATESNLKAIQRNSLLHIATHGYFLKDVEKASWPIGVHSDFAKGNVLLRSGLILSGAAEGQNANTGLDNTNNGIITAYEAMNLNLNETSLVVLSACETGLGEIKAGEGVYGLQRAFLVAGAEALIMSLWKVDDLATQQLMNNFYSNWLKTGEKQKAFKQAQLQLMTKYKEPYYWGAFVMMGE